MPRPKLPLIDRLQRYSLPEPNTGCWLWGGDWDVNGYGKINIIDDAGIRRMRKAHLVYYEVTVGPVPAGMELDHKCRVRCCVNPAHMEPVTHEENMLRGLHTVQLLQSTKTHCPAGHPYDEINTKRRTDRGWNARECRACHLIASRAYKARQKERNSIGG